VGHIPEKRNKAPSELYVTQEYLSINGAQHRIISRNFSAEPIFTQHQIYSQIFKWFYVSNRRNLFA
jgi:hypothetical protein